MEEPLNVKRLSKDIEAMLRRHFEDINDLNKDKIIDVLTAF